MCWAVRSGCRWARRAALLPVAARARGRGCGCRHPAAGVVGSTWAVVGAWRHCASSGNPTTKYIVHPKGCTMPPQAAHLGEPAAWRRACAGPRLLLGGGWLAGARPARQRQSRHTGSAASCGRCHARPGRRRAAAAQRARRAQRGHLLHHLCLLLCCIRLTAWLCCCCRRRLALRLPSGAAVLGGAPHIAVGGVHQPVG